MYQYVDTAAPSIFKDIEEKKTLDDNLKAAMTKAIKEYKERFVSERQTAAKASA
jgi:F0F1-type ATP synthase alpha subunit